MGSYAEHHLAQPVPPSTQGRRWRYGAKYTDRELVVDGKTAYSERRLGTASHKAARVSDHATFGHYHRPLERLQCSPIERRSDQLLVYGLAWFDGEENFHCLPVETFNQVKPLLELGSCRGRPCHLVRR